MDGMRNGPPARYSRFARKAARAKAQADLKGLYGLCMRSCPHTKPLTRMGMKSRWRTESPCGLPPIPRKRAEWMRREISAQAALLRFRGRTGRIRTSAGILR